MEYNRLGLSGLGVSALSFGTATFGGDTEFFKAWGDADHAHDAFRPTRLSPSRRLSLGMIAASVLMITFGLIGAAMAQERILISSDWGQVTAELVNNSATRSLVQMLPLSIEMRDHLRQEKTGNLPLPAVERQVDFSTGTLGLWSSNDFVIYYRSGRVPQPGIILLGRVTGDVSIFDRPGSVTVRVERINK